MANFPGSFGDDLIDGTASADTISDGGDGNDTLNGGDGDDVITSTGDMDSINGGNGVDRLVIDASTSTIDEQVIGNGSGNTSFWVNSLVTHFVSYSNIENVTFNGGSGNDNVRLIDGNNIVTLGSGTDILVLGTGTIDADGGSGIDGVLFDESTAAVSFNLGAAPSAVSACRAQRSISSASTAAPSTMC